MFLIFLLLVVISQVRFFCLLGRFSSIWRRKSLSLGAGLLKLYRVVCRYQILLAESSTTRSLITFFSVGGFSVDLMFLSDSLSFWMSRIVVTVRIAVQWYGFMYMEDDPHLFRFLGFLELFVFFMLILVNAANFVCFFIGWEGVGLMSYLLISFWFTRLQAIKSALKAMFYNKIGDIRLLMGVCLLAARYGTFDFIVLQRCRGYFERGGWFCELVGFLLLGGVRRKSAQIGFHTWLTDAIEGPTPVSALLHAATIVTAGIYLVVRCFWVFEGAPFVKSIMFVVALLTLFIAGLFATVDNDIKKVVALSTCGHLGLMLLLCSLSAYSAGFFHLLNHAFSKAILFITSGVVIHAINGEQDRRYFFYLKNFIPLTFQFIFLSSSALIGLPFLSSFFSKEVVFNLGQIQIFLSSSLIFVVVLLVTIFTTLVYSEYLISIFFYSKRVINVPRVLFFKLSDVSGGYIALLGILAFRAFIIGIRIYDIFIVQIVFDVVIYCDAQFWAVEYLPFWVKCVPILIMSCCGVGVQYSFFYVEKRLRSSNWYTIFLNNVYRGLGWVCSFCVLKVLDKGVFSNIIKRLVTIFLFCLPRRTVFKYTGGVYRHFRFVCFFMIFLFCWINCYSYFFSDFAVLFALPIYGFIGKPQPIADKDMNKVPVVKNFYNRILAFEKANAAVIMEIALVLKYLDTKTSKLPHFGYNAFTPANLRVMKRWFYFDPIQEEEIRYLRVIPPHRFRNVKKFTDRDAKAALDKRGLIACYGETFKDSSTYRLPVQLDLWRSGKSIVFYLKILCELYSTVFKKIYVFWTKVQKIREKGGILWRKETGELIYKWFWMNENNSTVTFSVQAELLRFMFRRTNEMFRKWWVRNIEPFFDSLDGGVEGAWIRSSPVQRALILFCFKLKEVLWIFSFKTWEDVGYLYTKYEELNFAYSALEKILLSGDGKTLKSFIILGELERMQFNLVWNFIYGLKGVLLEMISVLFSVLNINVLCYNVERRFGSKRSWEPGLYSAVSEEWVRYVDLVRLNYIERMKCRLAG